jgi:hypothetical protein
VAAGLDGARSTVVRPLAAHSSAWIKATSTSHRSLTGRPVSRVAKAELTVPFEDQVLTLVERKMPEFVSNSEASSNLGGIAV